MLKGSALSLLIMTLLLIAYYGKGVSNYHAFTIMLYTFGGIFLLLTICSIYKLQSFRKAQRSTAN